MMSNRDRSISTRGDFTRRKTSKNVLLLGILPLLTALLLLVPPQGTMQAQQFSLSTIQANTDLDGMTFNIVAHAAVEVKKLWVAFSPWYWGPTTAVNIRYRPGGVQAIPGQAPYLDPAWVNVGTTNSFYPNLTGYTEIPLNLSIVIPAGQTYGFYISSTTMWNYDMGMYYNSPTKSWTDGLITIDAGTNAGYGVEGYPLDYCYSGYQFCGRVDYNLLPGIDVAMRSIISPSSPISRSIHPLTVRFLNARSQKIKTVNLGYKFGSSAPVTVSNVVLPDSLNPGQTFDYTFATPLDMTAGGFYDLKAWVTHPNGSYPDSSIANDTLAVTICTALEISAFTINPLGSGPTNFTTFNQAVNALLCGITTPVVFTVSPGTYNEQLTIPEIPGASAINPIIFNGGTGNMNNVILTHNTPTQNSSTLQLDGADFISFKNMTIRATGGSYGYAVYLTNQANHNTFDSVRIETSTTSTSSNHIALLASSQSNNYDSGDWANNTTVRNCIIRGGYYAVRFNGISTSGDQCQYNVFHNNTVSDFYYYGMYLYNQRYLEVVNNTVTQRSPAGTTAGYGLYVYYAQGGPIVKYNYVRVEAQPLRMYYCNGYNIMLPRSKVYNNMLVATNLTATQYGMYIYYCRNTDVWFNTSHMATNGTGYGAYLYGVSGHDVDFRNNMITYGGTTGAGRLLYNNASAMFGAFNYNLYYSENSTYTAPFRYNNTDYASWTALPKTVHNINSVYGKPYYTSATDLHSASTTAFRAGVSIPEITDDFDRDTRVTGYPPCIGADEFPQPPPEFDMTLAAVRMETATNKWAHREGAATHQVKVVVENTGLGSNPTQLPVVYKIGSAPTGSTDGVAQTFSPTWVGKKAVLAFTQPVTGLMPNTSVTVYARCFLPNDQVPGNDVNSSTHLIQTDKVHGYENFAGMVAPDFSFYPGFLDQPWIVNNVNGGATWVVQDAVGVGATPALYYPGDSQTANDWVFTPGAQLVAGSSYRVSFQARSISGQPQRIEVAFGDAPNPGAMTTFAVFSNFTNTSFMTSKQLAGVMDPYFNTPNIHQVYYVGFRVNSGANRGALAIDDIKLDDNPSPPPKIGYGLPGVPITQFIDDPTIPIVVTANYKTPGTVNRTYEVATTTNIYGSAGDFLWDVETTTPWMTVTKAVPDPTLQNFNFTPPRPRQFQTFTMSIDPSGLAPGVHTGYLTFYGILFNDDFPPPASGLVATNEPFVVPVQLRIIQSGSGAGPASLAHSINAPMTVMGSPYDFYDVSTGTPIARVNVTSGQIDQMTIRVYPNQLPQNLARYRYVKRYWQISHVGTGWTADIDFPYTDPEASMVTDPFQLRGIRQAVNLGAWEDPISGTSSVSDPMTNTVTVMNLNHTNIGGNIALAHPYMTMFRDVDGAVPTAFSLERNYPNPFNPTTTMTFNVAEERNVRLVVYNALGMEVAELVHDILGAGRYSVTFDASALPSGSYLCRMIAGDFVESVQMTLSK